MRKITGFAVYAALFGTVFVSPAFADRIIFTPAPAALFSDNAKLEFDQSTGDDRSTQAWANFGSPYTELEVAEFHKPGVSAGAFSLESQILPETAELPALAFGVRDVGNNTYRFAASGYYGRSVYAVAGRTPVKFATAPYPLRNLSYSAGVGLGGIKGPFASASADLPLHLHWTVEWDSRSFNERVALTLAPFARLEYQREDTANYVGFAIYTPVSMF